MNNPFAVKSPEILSVKEINSLFIDVFSDFPKVISTGHTFIHGARGTGKSMMLRYQEPLVQLVADKDFKIGQLKYYGIYIPIRNSGLSVTEWARMKGFSYHTLAEHMIVMHISVKIFSSLINLCPCEAKTAVSNTILKKFLQNLRAAGWTGDNGLFGEPGESDQEIFNYIINICDYLFKLSRSYLGHLSINKEGQYYNGPLCNYLDFLLPLAIEIINLDYTPKGPIYLLIDDADELPLGLQKILNTWVSCRTTAHLCLKISTQTTYATYETLSGKYIESPHDYSEVNISTIYTSDKNHYYNRIKRIVTKRLELYGLQNDPEKFFPPNNEQEEKINQIKQELIEKWEAKKADGKGSFRSSDEATRYATPEYIRRLGGTSKNRPTFSYAGFKSMVDVSSGIIRWFLEPASNMYAEEISKTQGKKIDAIPHQIQDKVLREWSTDFFLKEPQKVLASIKSQDQEHPSKMDANTLLKMIRLIDSICKLFKTKLLDEHSSERRISSFMICDTPDEDLEKVLALAVRLGYLQTSDMGDKEGLGRKPRYVISRRLAPYYTLDPGGYAACMSITSKALNIACIDSERFIRERTGHDIDMTPEPTQQELF